jgi:hypothetical protein
VKLTGNEKGNKDLNRFILELAIDIYNKHFEIKPLGNGEGISFNSSGLLPKYFKILEMKGEHVSLGNIKTQGKINVEIKKSAGYVCDSGIETSSGDEARGGDNVFLEEKGIEEEVERYFGQVRSRHLRHRFVH